MKKRMENYIKYINELLQNNSDDTNWNLVKSDFLTQLAFYQHERLIHLIVTVLFALLAVMTIGIAIVRHCITMFLSTFALMVLLIPYIFHYHFLENSVQKMYEQYDEIMTHL